MRRMLLAVALLALTTPAPALAKGEFDPSEEFVLDEWVPIHLGPLDLSINKAVVYLWLGAVVTVVLGYLLMRFRLRTDPDRRQTAGEWVYEIAQTQVAEQGLPTKAIGRWFPYVASLMLFIWVVNMLGFIPLPLTGETYEVLGVDLPIWGIYAATSQLSVTLALALLTFVFTHAEGIRFNGPGRYFKSWMPSGMPPFTLKWAVPLSLLYLLEVLGQFMRLISLSVRLFANMLAGHILILTFIGLIFVLENVFLAIVAVPVATVFYLFEVLIVVTIQAFIFAALSAIYIGSAIEPGH
jgi:F-type H+-transporting ATPase subunit a